MRHPRREHCSLIDAMARHEVLTVDEEIAAARAINRARAGGGARYRAAVAVLVGANMRLVLSVANRHQRRGLELEDLVQEGAIGLQRAAELFDAERGVRFSTYACWWITQGIRRALQNHAELVRLPVHVRDARTRVGRSVARFMAAAGREPIDAELRTMTGLTAAQLERARATGPVVSLDAPVAGGEMGARSWYEFLADDGAVLPSEGLEQRERAELVDELLEQLTPKQRHVLRARFGDDETTLQETGEELGVCRERIRQLQLEALDRARAALRRRSSAACSGDV